MEWCLEIISDYNHRQLYINFDYCLMFVCPMKSDLTVRSYTIVGWFLLLPNWCPWYVNSSPPGQNGRHFTDNVFGSIFMNEKFCILIKFSLKFAPKGPIDNNPALVQIMAWRRIGDKPLSEPILTDSLTHICGTRGRWVKLVHTPQLVTFFHYQIKWLWYVKVDALKY